MPPIRTWGGISFKIFFTLIDGKLVYKNLDILLVMSFRLVAHFQGLVGSRIMLLQSKVMAPPA